MPNQRPLERLALVEQPQAQRAQQAEVALTAHCRQPLFLGPDRQLGICCTQRYRRARMKLSLQRALLLVLALGSLLARRAPLDALLHARICVGCHSSSFCSNLCTYR